ncbi:hypothetical protein H696_01595 [Fonticula alba]|uniref:Uncharacterized protein n=1 Tax=Fonticula alba TaxID=691883 RepID=A0A058ZCQ7_FONAL|nr:hypothetical protein H696_01595 [Fonticula alba]KCV72195.1 hypothetical protein H696_01595 [Fonticula alba]|eukprot:XP_009493773.1 hypothetical protein H696_01595 [Fonticula alba]
MTTTPGPSVGDICPVRGSIASAVAHFTSPQIQWTDALLANITYGTAGFRRTADPVLESIATKVGVAAALRSFAAGGAAVGVMITASHNPPQDNGLKIIDTQGQMLEAAWEPVLGQAARLADALAVADSLLSLVDQATIERLRQAHAAPPGQPLARVLVGVDNRPSCPGLKAALLAGARSILPPGKGVELLDMRSVTTPAVHWAVARANGLDPLADREATLTPATYYAGFQRHFDAFLAATRDVLRHLGVEGPARPVSSPTPCPVFVDHANGVGATVLESMHLAPGFCQIYNDPLPAEQRGSVVNAGCGADFVKSKRLPPGRGSFAGLPPALRIASLDGDGDRLIYSSLSTTTRAFDILDGDRIAVLLLRLMRSLIAVVVHLRPEVAASLRLGFVQTRYANGASTKYTREVLGVETLFANSGVKNLHALAERHFDVGVYFEANGHGTVLFSPAACRALLDLAATPADQAPLHHAARALLSFSRLFNQFTGDGIGLIYAVEAALRAQEAWRALATCLPAGQGIPPGTELASDLDVELRRWIDLYRDWPSHLQSLKLDRTKFLTSPDQEDVLCQPTEVAQALAAEVARLNGLKTRCGLPLVARAFVRPSGTEDIVRLFTEVGTADGTVTGDLADICHDAATDLARIIEATFRGLFLG